jgi:hypothetical protein
MVYLLIFVFYTVLHLGITCIYHFKIRSFIYMVDPAEPKTEELMEQAPAKASINPDLSQGNPRYIPSMILNFSFKSLSLC